MASGPYQYIPGPNTLGIGVDNMALVRPGIGTDEPHYGKRYNVRKSFSPLMGGAQFPLAQSGPMVDLRANGVYMSGELALAQLTEFNQNMAKGK